MTWTDLHIDAGANAGYVTRFFAHAYPRAHIVAVEPEARNAAICRKNTELLSRVTVVEAAIGARAGCVSLGNINAQSNAIRTYRSDSGIPVVTVSQLKARVDKSRLLIVKVDIEGFEADLFASDTDWISETCVLIAEPHDWMLPGAGSSRALQQTMSAKRWDMLISAKISFG